MMFLPFHGILFGLARKEKNGSSELESRLKLILLFEAVWTWFIFSNFDEILILSIGFLRK